MSDPGDSDHRPPPRRLIDAAAKARFLAALRAGAHLAEAAHAAGFHLRALYNSRARDPAFRLGWIWALELSAADEQTARLAPPPALPDDETIGFASQGKRVVQVRRMRWIRFTEARKQIFLNHFAATADNNAAAAAAGVSVATVNLHRRRRPEFAALWQQALALAYPSLHAEALRRRLAEQRRLAERLEPDLEAAREIAYEEEGAEFDRVMKLLARWDRGGGRIGVRETRHGRLKAVSFDEAIEALSKKLGALGIPVLKDFGEDCPERP